MRKHLLLALTVALLLPAAAAAFENQIGFGIHYWTALDDLEDEGFDESGTSIYGAWRLGTPGPLAFEVDLEYFDDSFAGADGSAFSPQVYVLLGGFVYGGVGVGVTFADLPDGSDVSDPFWAARLGLSIPLFVRVRLDLNANYQADSFANLGDASSDSITLGAALRFKLD
ncbi:MAG: hypothetical protein R2991_10585 [Thermoanaerobaculia bacterium]